jgi:O-glycosyl hydrolase
VFPATIRLSAATITVNANNSYQVIDGFGVNINHWNINEVQPVLDAFVDQAGMTLFRMLYDRTDWEASNDNGDPNVMNWGYYNDVYSAAGFQTLWDDIAYLNQKGIADGVMLNFMGRGPSWMVNTSLIPGYEGEWAEMIASLLVYARNTRHLQFGLVAPNNEPDNAADARLPRVLMSSGQYVTALRALAQLLDANGLNDLRLVAPDLAYTSTAWLSAIMADPVVMSKVSRFGLHSYQDNGGGSAGIYSFLQQSAYPDRSFWMTEFNAWCSSCENCAGGDNSWSFARSSASYMLNHLANGASAGLWFEGYDTYMDYLGCWSYWGLFAVNNINAVPKTFTPRKGFYTVAQISKFVQPGTRRIALTGSPSPLNVLAFYHPGTGQLVLVGVNPGASATSLSASLVSLSMVSSLDLYYTSSSANLYRAGSVPVSNGAFTTTLPADCVFTLVSSPVVSAQLTNPLEGARFTSPATIALSASASTAAGSLVTVEFFNGATRLGEVTSAPYNLTWNDVPPGTYWLTARAANSFGNFSVSPAVHVTVLGPSVQISVAPSSATVLPYGTQQFAAVATDAFGISLDPQPLFAWSANGGGAIDANGLFTAGGQFGGPFAVTASGSGTTGAGQVSIVSNGKPILPPQRDVEIDELSPLTVTNTASANPLVNHLTTNTLLFTYTNREALLADGWSFLATLPSGAARNTEIANPADGAVVSYDQSAHPGVLRIPCDEGDLWAALNNTRNSLFRDLPANWFSLELALAFGPLTADYQQAHLGVYQNDDNFVQIGVAFNSGDGNERFTMDRELGGSPNPFAKAPTTSATLYFRLDRDPVSSNITGWYSFDALSWTALGTTNAPLTNPRLGIWAGGSSVPYAGNMPNLDLRRLTVILADALPATLAYSLLNPPAGASIDTNGVVTWQPGEAQGPGTNTLTTVVSDNAVPPAGATNSFTVVVHEINAAPVLPSQADRVLAPMQTLVVTNTAADADLPTNTLSYQLLDAPAGALIDGHGVITWTPAPSQAPGTNVFTTEVTDFNPYAVNEQYLRATNSFKAFVASVPAFHILSVAVSGDTAVITWEAFSGLTYRLQCTTNLARIDWQDLSPDITATGPSASATHPVADEQSRFYRVLLLP